MTPDDLKEALRLHAAWLADEDDGVRANLRRANLRRADLSDANLWRADLSDANLSDANLSDANLRRANLSDADLSDANLRRANLSDADLWRADLSDANLWRANLSGANLSGANLSGANLSDANLSDANLWRANLRRAYGLIYQIAAGDLIGWKKLSGGVIAELLIPFRARRTATPVGRKCRAELAVVKALLDPDGEPVERAYDRLSGTLRYEVGKEVWPDSYDDDFRVECTHGIHFFQTREEAEAW